MKLNLLKLKILFTGALDFSPRLKKVVLDSFWLVSATVRFAHMRGYLPLHIVTGADITHEKSLLRLLESIQRFEPLAQTTVWDLGLSREAAETLADMASVDLRSFSFIGYPDYFDIRIQAGQYAWKPIIIRETRSDVKELLVWLDAGCLILGKLTWLRKICKTLGFFSPSSSGNLEKWTHPGTLRHLNFIQHPGRYNNVNGAVVAHQTNHTQAAELISEWAACAMERECIAPNGSSRSNHRQDQAVLSVLAIQRGFSGKELFRNLRRPLKIAIHQDVD
jgi:hypothetical protein